MDGIPWQVGYEYHYKVMKEGWVHFGVMNLINSHVKTGNSQLCVISYLQSSYICENLYECHYMTVFWVCLPSVKCCMYVVYPNKGEGGREEGKGGVKGEGGGKGRRKGRGVGRGKGEGKGGGKIKGVCSQIGLFDRVTEFAFKFIQQT